MVADPNPDDLVVDFANWERTYLLMPGERRTVTVGVSDLFFAEIQDGLQNGETVLLEQPKEEREKKAQAKDKQQQAGGAAPAAPAPKTPAATPRTARPNT